MIANRQNDGQYVCVLQIKGVLKKNMHWISKYANGIKLCINIHKWVNVQLQPAECEHVFLWGNQGAESTLVVVVSVI